MTSLNMPEQAECEAIAFIGESLAPFFLEDPRTGNAQAAFLAVASLDVGIAAQEWPFVEEGPAYAPLKRMADGLNQGTSDDLMWEFRRLFIGPALKQAPPWGSVYTDREGVIFGASTLELRSWMRLKGIERQVDDKTPEDHLGLLLALMAWIAREQPEALDDFLCLHLLTWSSHFLEHLAGVAQHPFYQGLAELTQLSLEGIQNARSLEVAYPRFYR